MKLRNLILTAPLFLFAIERPKAADQQRPVACIRLLLQQQASGLVASSDNPGFLPDEGQLRQDAAYEDREFTGRFNNLVRVLHDFAETYNTGQVINAKNARAVRKAMRDLEKSAWFRPQTGE